MSGREQQKLFDEWLQAYKGVLIKVVRSYALVRNDQEELFQVVCVELWKSIANYRGEASVATWVYRVALYAAMAWNKKEKKHRANKDPIKGTEQLLIVQPEQKSEKLNWLYQQLNQLNEVDRSLMLLLLDDFSYKEMANILGISETNVGVKINRIKKKLSAKSSSFFKP
ncbi:MAG: sigma-70 family RNA polymerase sigma factor [Saprospiraceae bacterium]|nr:sigma-70 family RNA polymerase sigma factor [Saprospiraceae bacterium]